MKSGDDIAVICVDPGRVGEMWPHVREFIVSAFENDRGDDSVEDVRADLIADLALLWVAWDGGKISAAATTKLIKTSRGLICIITACGGREMGAARWRSAIQPIEDFAKAEGCALIRIEGRRGWTAVFPDYREAWVSLEKRL